VTTFILLCVAMLAAAVLWLVIPLLRAPRCAALEMGKKAGQEAPSFIRERLLPAAAIVMLPVLAVFMYLSLSQWDWREAQQVTARNAEMETLLVQLEDKLAQDPANIEGWLLLGRSTLSMEQYPHAVTAFQRAYDLSGGHNVEAMIGLGESLVLSDESALGTRARGLFEDALKRAPHHPKALWYGSIAALQAGELSLGRDRLRLLLAQNPPEELRAVLERQIQDLDQQLAEAAAPMAAAESASAAGGKAPAAPQRRIRVTVSLAPSLQNQLREPLPLFILARDPSVDGPPLAVQRRSSVELPLTLELSEHDAMLPTHTIAGVPRVQVVARLSRGGSPQAHSGDLYGEADYAFEALPGGGASSQAPGVLSITIDRTVP